MELALEITRKLIKHPFGQIFAQPVDPVTDGAPDYFEKIKNPMDFGTIEEKLREKKYADTKEWESDVNLVFENCIEYNGADTVFPGLALFLQKYFRKQLKRLRVVHYQTWIEYLIEIYWKLSELLKRKLRTVAKGIEQNLSGFMRLTEQDYNNLALRLSSVNSGDEIKPIIQILCAFGVDPMIKSKKGRVNLKSCPTAAVEALRQFVRK
jgi:hypothetical protein